MTKEAISTERALKLALEALEANQPAQRPIKTFHDGKPWPLQEPAQPQQEPVAYRSRIRNRDGQVITEWVVHLEKSKKPSPRYEIESLYTTSPARKPLTHEQRVDLLAKFEAHKNEWHAPAILIDMVEAAHGIKEKNT